jgi:hypothetical protein
MALLHLFALLICLILAVSTATSFLRRSNFYPADFLPEPSNLSFKELAPLIARVNRGRNTYKVEKKMTECSFTLKPDIV